MRVLIKLWMLFWTIPYLASWLIYVAMSFIGFGPGGLATLMQGGPILLRAHKTFPWFRR